MNAMTKIRKRLREKSIARTSMGLEPDVTILFEDLEIAHRAE